MVLVNQTNLHNQSFFWILTIFFSQTKSNKFSLKPFEFEKKLLESNEFTKSNKFSLSNKFSISFKLTDSKHLSKSSFFTKSNLFDSFKLTNHHLHLYFYNS